MYNGEPDFKMTALCSIANTTTVINQRHH